MRRCSSLVRGKLRMQPTYQVDAYRALAAPHAVLLHLRSGQLGQLSAIGEADALILFWRPGGYGPHRAARAIGEVDALILFWPAHVGQTSRSPLRSTGDPAIASGDRASR